MIPHALSSQNSSPPQAAKFPAENSSMSSVIGPQLIEHRRSYALRLPAMYVTPQNNYRLRIR